jgi:hypothetical protein
VPDDSDRRFGLSRFSDEEIVQLAWALAGAQGSREALSLWRRRLGVPDGGIAHRQARSRLCGRGALDSHDPPMR